jgi:hypothetical protein
MYLVASKRRQRTEFVQYKMTRAMVVKKRSCHSKFSAVKNYTWKHNVRNCTKICDVDMFIKIMRASRCSLNKRT